jgi:Bacterial SH3 domain
MTRKWHWKSFVGIVGCLVGLGVIYFGYGIGTETPKKEATAGPSAAPHGDLKKPVRAMNLALGNMVFFAQDLGFSAQTVDGSQDANKISARIESQLQGMRELYRAETSKNPDLAGSVTLQFNITPSGEVSQVKELSSRINGVEFKKAIIAEAAKWSFAELVSENVSVTCPLLFVHQGMDITTLVQWEKIMGNLPEKTTPGRQVAIAAPSPAANGSRRSSSATVAAKMMPGAGLATAGPGDAEAKVFQIKYATSLRKDPNFSSPSLTTFTIGTKVSVLQKQGEWLEVQSTNNGPVGFIRKEFVAPLQVAHQ